MNRRKALKVLLVAPLSLALLGGGFWRWWAPLGMCPIHPWVRGVPTPGVDPREAGACPRCGPGVLYTNAWGEVA